ncbi:hypothetical protein A3758_12730 [Oleiphilus sp. HI0118]|jgi:hypothetical protein|nr:hypothetical protein A3758_12730 [Oleiphilus sp. HI0118]
MKAIHKYQLNTDGSETALNLKENYRIAHAEYVLVEKAVFVWVEEPLAAKIPTREVEFLVARSGDPLSSEFDHVATAVDSLAPEAYHIFCKRPEAAIYPITLSEQDFVVSAAS